MEGYKDKHYGLTGQTVRVRQKSWQGSPYPWGKMEVPVKITAEYPRFLCGTVMPHRNPFGLGESIPYPITINKHDVFIGEMIINGGKIR